ncbi:MAG: response regulator [Gemmatimonadaceae bacterium]
MTVTEAPPTAPIRILIAEDDPNARSLLISLLGSLGYLVVSEASTGQEAVDRAREVLPDAVLLDVHMPDKTGIEAAEEITRSASGIAVILFTGDASVSLSDRDLVATSAIALLPKPAPPRTLDSTIRLAVTRARELSAAKADATDARTELENRKVIERAKGILMRRIGGSEQEAYKILQRTSQDRAVPMVEVAKDVLASEPGSQEKGGRRGRPKK